jgi:hypothetical protein
MQVRNEYLFLCLSIIYSNFNIFFKTIIKIEKFVDQWLFNQTIENVQRVVESMFNEIDDEIH